MSTTISDLPRLRQLVLASENLAETRDILCHVLQIQPGFVDDLAVFGLENVVIPLGDTFLEIVSPIIALDQCAAGRSIIKAQGDCGYMVIVQLQDHSTIADKPAIWSIDRHDRGVDIKASHLHPKTYGTILSIDEMQPASAWPWCGTEENWRAKINDKAVHSLSYGVMACTHPEKTAKLWQEVLPGSLSCDSHGMYTLQWPDTSMKFSPRQQQLAMEHISTADVLVGFGIHAHDKAGILQRAQSKGLTVDAQGFWCCQVRFELV